MEDRSETDAGPRHFIVATAGHIDHGKSSLVRALTGTDPDRLPEEKARGMTIDLGFAHLDLETPGGPRSIGIVDVPGHADFVRNMVAGVGPIDMALIVVAADDSWMPQSEEHVQILAYLGIERAVVAVTKIDLAGDDAELAVEDIREHLEGTPFASVPIVPVSSMTGAGLDDLRRAMSETLASIPPRIDQGRPRLAIDRAFSPTGVGTVVTGTLAGGTLSRGSAVRIEPAGLTGRVRSIQNHRAVVDEAVPGMRTALNIPDVPIAAERAERGLRRGHTVTVQGNDTTTNTFDVRLERAAREVPGAGLRKKTVTHGQRIRFHYGTASVLGRVFFADRKSLARGASAIAQLRMEEPVFVFTGDRFVLRDAGNRTTIAGGAVLDPHADPKRFRTAKQQELLEAFREGLGSPAAVVAARLRRDRIVDLDSLSANLPFPESMVRSAADTLVADNAAIQTGSRIADAAWLRSLAASAARAVRNHHRNRPADVAMPAAQLRAALGGDAREDACFGALLDFLRETGEFVAAPGGIRAADHQPTLPERLAARRDRVLRALQASPLEPPNPSEFLVEDEDREVARFLILAGDAVELSEKCLIAASAYRTLVDRIIARLADCESATVSELRETAGTSRRVIVPLLERLDKEGITARRGDLRALGRNAPRS